MVLQSRWKDILSPFRISLIGLGAIPPLDQLSRRTLLHWATLHLRRQWLGGTGASKCFGGRTAPVLRGRTSLSTEVVLAYFTTEDFGASPGEHRVRHGYFCGHARALRREIQPNCVSNRCMGDRIGRDRSYLFVLRASHQGSVISRARGSLTWRMQLPNVAPSRGSAKRPERPLLSAPYSRTGKNEACR